MSDAPKGLALLREVFINRRVAIMIPLGAASGLPLILTGKTLSAWMASVDVDLTTIGLFAFAGLAYNLKFLWAPLLDRFRLPLLGRRRGWILATQLLVIAGLVWMSGIDPAATPLAMALAAMFLSFVSASQDIVVDAYRTDVLSPRERAAGVAIFVTSYRVAMIAAGAGALILSDHVSWRLVYLCMAGLMGIGVVGVLLAPRTASPADAPRTLGRAVWAPLSEFIGRANAARMLFVVLTYQVGDYVASVMMTPFLMDIGYTRTEIGVVSNGLGLAASIAGALVGGAIVARVGLRRSMLWFGVLQASANIVYALLARAGRDRLLFALAIVVDQLFNGLGNAAFVAFLMALCDPRYSATQYALLSSGGSVVGRLTGGNSGWIASRVGWPVFFIITMLLAGPAVVVLATSRRPDDENAWPPRPPQRA